MKVFDQLIFFKYVLGIGNSMVETTSYLMIQQHFSKHRALATGIAGLGFNMGNFIAPSPYAEFDRSVRMAGCFSDIGWYPGPTYSSFTDLQETRIGKNKTS